MYVIDYDAVAFFAFWFGVPLLMILAFGRRKVEPAPRLQQGAVNALPALALDWTVTQGIEGWSGHAQSGPWAVASRKEQGFAAGGGESTGKRTEWLRAVEVTGEGLAGLSGMLIGRVSTEESLSVGQADFDFRTRLNPKPAERGRLVTALSPAARSVLMALSELGEVSIRDGRLRLAARVDQSEWTDPGDAARLAGKLIEAAEAMSRALARPEESLAERATEEAEPAGRVIALDLLAERAPGSQQLVAARAAAARDPDPCVQWAASLARPGDALAAFPAHDAIAARWLRPRYHIFPDVPVDVLARVAGSGAAFAARAATLLGEGWGEAHEAVCLAALPDAPAPGPLLEVLGRHGGPAALSALGQAEGRPARAALSRLRSRLAEDRAGRLSPAQADRSAGRLSESD